MYITVNDVIGEKTIYLSHPIDTGKEIAVISMLSNNTQYEIKEPINLKLMGGGEKQILNGTYTLRELSALVNRKMIITDLNNHPQVIKMDKFAKITEMTLNLNELDNTDNLEDGRPSNALFKYHVSSYGEFPSLEPPPPTPLNTRSSKMVGLLL